MSICRDLGLIWNHQIPFRTCLSRRLSNHILNKNYSTPSSDLQQATSQTNETNFDQTNINQSSSRQSKQSLTKQKQADQLRLSALRDRLQKEDSLKEFKDFLNLDQTKPNQDAKPDAVIAKRRKPIPYLPEDFLDGNRQKVYLETYGCQV